jgi:hypothetical protein
MGASQASHFLSGVFRIGRLALGCIAADVVGADKT